MPKVLYLLPVLLFIAMTVFFFSYERAVSPAGAAAEIEVEGASGEPDVLGAYPELMDVRVDINCTDAAQWEQLPGIGPKKAAAIVEYIKANGPLARAEELLNVKGIGDKTLEALRPYLSPTPEP